MSVGRKPVKRLWINGDPIAGAFREALQLEEAIRLDNDYFMAIVNLAGIYNTKLNRPEEARELYARAIKLKSSDNEKQLIREAMGKLPL